MSEIATKYEPKLIEDKWYKEWMDKNSFRQREPCYTSKCSGYYIWGTCQSIQTF